jgi:hypothetical protein
MASRKSIELILLESLEKKISELLENIEIVEKETEAYVDLQGNGTELERIELTEESFKEIEKYCENKNNLVIGIS